MSSSSHKIIVRTYELKNGSCPVNGMNTYSVFKNGVLVFMMDGDRASVFKPAEVDVITDPENGEVRVYRVGDWVFSGSASLSSGIRRVLPKGCVIYPSMGSMVK